MKKILLPILFFGFALTTKAQWVTVPNVGWGLNNMQIVTPTQGFMVSTQSVWASTNSGTNWGILHYTQADSSNDK